MSLTWLKSLSAWLSLSSQSLPFNKPWKRLEHGTRWNSLKEFPRFTYILQSPCHKTRGIWSRLQWASPIRVWWFVAAEKFGRKTHCIHLSTQSIYSLGWNRVNDSMQNNLYHFVPQAKRGCLSFAPIDVWTWPSLFSWLMCGAGHEPVFRRRWDVWMTRFTSIWEPSPDQWRSKRGLLAEKASYGGRYISNFPGVADCLLVRSGPYTSVTVSGCEEVILWPFKGVCICL